MALGLIKLMSEQLSVLIYFQSLHSWKVIYIVLYSNNLAVDFQTQRSHLISSMLCNTLASAVLAFSALTRATSFDSGLEWISTNPFLPKAV